jgi:hypothetical protein
MTKVNSKELLGLYTHLSVQSMLDIKANFGEITIKVLEKLNDECNSSFSIEENGITQCIGFVYDTGDVYNFILYTSARFMVHKDSLIEKIKDKLKLLQNKEINSIIHRDSRQLLKVLSSVGFEPQKEVRKYKILRLVNK